MGHDKPFDKKIPLLNLKRYFILKNNNFKRRVLEEEFEQ